MEGEYEKLGPLLLDYCYKMIRGEYQDSDWSNVNAMWRRRVNIMDYLIKYKLYMQIYCYIFVRSGGASSDLVLDDYLRMEEYERPYFKPLPI